ncbi:MAG TPA: hypothetical protein PK385_02780 [Spirochaetota bacterium]|nr:hypothetical protein [Spirochaetota bacterium]HOS31702.1 hypothetical protein [Spirochaetota bacterium]HOS54963.1 hypothetical protein [Spirochaetota bacterium]HPK62633.1 hypothetical protein [Spirochaetota bacterium]HQF78194.1 hypothetical protein [Spirochaetota bacterium]
MKKASFVFLIIFALAFTVNANVKNLTKTEIKAPISFVKTINDANYKNLSVKYSSDGDSFDFKQYKKLLFGLTIAFATATFTFLSLAIIFSVLYGVSDKMAADANANSRFLDEANWLFSKNGLLVGVISGWSLLTLFSICAIISGIMYLMSDPNYTVINEFKKKADLLIAPGENSLGLVIALKV